ncbi:MAG: choice-of-anchor A family protein [Colwellia sp.]|nr:choice-of-anchor A family protein [Colwellia sp.]
MMMLLVGLLLSLPVFSLQIDLGDAAKYNAFFKNDFNVHRADTQGRVAVGGNMNVNGQYSVGDLINQFDMGDGPALVVAGDVNKTDNSAFLTVLNGDLLYAGNVTGTNISANLVNTEKENLPINFDDAFAYLDKLSDDLMALTATGSTTKAGWYLDFTPSVTPDDNIYVFEVTQEQMNTTGGWRINGVSDDATVVFNITNSNNIAGENTWSNNTCLAGQLGCVEISQTNISINGELLSSRVNEFNLDNRLSSQVLFNFSGASEVNLASDLYATILAPSADIKTNDSVIWGQVIGKSWQGGMQINYDPFQPVGKTVSVPLPPTIWLFILGLAAVLYNHKRNSIHTTESATNIAAVVA